ncbi:hypothetical protein HN827_06540 [archaeon]|jgi:hypothetical protein|nr:hypothetical protein [archaeon]MBT7392460.1 hypothetical protein [archaeon]
MYRLFEKVGNTFDDKLKTIAEKTGQDLAEIIALLQKSVVNIPYVESTLAAINEYGDGSFQFKLSDGNVVDKFDLDTDFRYILPEKNKSLESYILRNGTNYDPNNKIIVYSQDLRPTAMQEISSGLEQSLNINVEGIQIYTPKGLIAYQHSFDENMDWLEESQHDLPRWLNFSEKNTHPKTARLSLNKKIGQKIYSFLEKYLGRNDNQKLNVALGLP